MRNSPQLAAVITKTTAPWDEDTVKMLNTLQANEQLHPYTCPGERPCCRGQENAHMRTLRATRNGWVCRCSFYRQNWAVFHAPL